MTETLKFTVGGVEIFLNRELIEEKLQNVEPENIREVSVQVNGRRYPVKQALAEATGLLRGNFTSHDAMRVFRKLNLLVGTGPGDYVLTAPERFFTVIKSLNQFDQQEVRPVVGSIVNKADRDHCFAGIYYRAKANVESLLSLKYAKDVQASTMLARSLFEFAVELVYPCGWSHRFQPKGRDLSTVAGRFLRACGQMLCNCVDRHHRRIWTSEREPWC